MEQDLTKGYVMIVEDDKLLLDAIEEKMTKNGIPHKGFTEGTQALRFLVDKGERPSIIWLDYYLGDTNGLAFMKILKANPELKNIPVIIVSNSTGGEKIKALMDIGADEYIVKANHTLRKIISKMQKVLENSSKSK